MAASRSVAVFAALFAIALCVSAQRNDDYNSEEFLEDAAASPNNYTYLSICANETSDTLYPVEGKECEDRKLQVALGKYRNRMNETGWGYLEIETFAGFDPEIQAYAAGVAEGILSQQQIYWHYRNTVEGNCKGYTQYCKRLYDYLQKNLDWIKSKVIHKPKTDLFWRQVNLTFTQLTGLTDAYLKRSLAPAVKFELNALYMIQLSGELIDLNKFLKRKPDPVHDDPDPGRCSGLVKLTEGNKDLLFSHVAMSGYNTMNRVVKLYKFAYDKKEVPGHTQSFSGYAGQLASADDYTLISSGLASIETTISIFNETLYTDKFMKPVGQLHCWVRSIVANSLAKTGREWVKHFGRYNSGTYNNQWTVLDYKLFSPGKDIPSEGVLWVQEQVPGYTLARDMTWFLRKYKYWPSYNIPYFTEISKLSGFEGRGGQYNWWRWGSSPRAKIFDRDHHLVSDIASLRKLMRYNNYKQDEFSKCKCTPPFTAEAAISARGDLNPSNGTYELEGMGHRNHGSLDYKGTDYEHFKQLRFEAIGGPTFNEEAGVPVFSWGTTDIVSPHYGQPTVWKFDPVITEWETSVEVDLK
ncbi:hypothetical protein QR680_013894 [Steinernema hermaphroditum]|uniref:Phospholipase B-like n=1 Tax=Steinernema hermaphroditum TaxID=289476 RepID=A0AA39I8M7_9BILA|nr:hypothetical protein QR680_013894 [Steinernema hermaphroditum]